MSTFYVQGSGKASACTSEWLPKAALMGKGVLSPLTRASSSCFYTALWVLSLGGELKIAPMVHIYIF